MKKFNFYKSFKYILMGFATLILAGIIVLCCCGFNLGVEFDGGSKFTIEPKNASLLSDSVYQDEYLNKQDEIIERVEKVLKNNKIYEPTVQIEGEGNDQVISFIFKNTKGLQVDELKNQLIRDISTVSSEIDYQINGIDEYSASTSLDWWLGAAMLCVIILVIFVYFTLRFFPFAAITTMLGMFLDLLLTAAVFAFTRIEITKFIGCAALISIVFGAIYQIIIFSKIKTSYLENELGDKTNKEITAQAIKKSTLLILIFSSIIALFGIVMMFFNISFGLYFVVPILITTISSIYFSPVLFGIIARKKKFVPMFNKFNR